MNKNGDKKKAFKSLIEKKTTKRVIMAIAAVVALFVIFRLFLLFFSVRHFEIEGDTKYTLNEIVNAAGIRMGDRLYYIDEDEVEERILNRCPHIQSVSIECDFPNTVIFVIEERKTGWYLQVGEDYMVLDYDLKVIAETANELELTERGLTKLVLPELESAVVGKNPEFGKGDQRLKSETVKVLYEIRNDPMKNRITYLNLENRFEIKLTVDFTYEVYFGDMGESETKFEMIEKIIENSKAKGYVGGKITFNGPTDPAFDGYFPDVEDIEGDSDAE